MSFFIFLSIACILLIGYTFLEKEIYTESAALFLFILAIIQVFGLQYFLKNQLKNEVKIKNLELRIRELKAGFESTEKMLDYNSVYMTNLSYEIRTPLSTVLGMLNMLKLTDLDANQQAQIEIAEYSSKHLLQLVNMVTSNAEVEKDEIKLNLKAMDLKADLTKLFKVFEYQAFDKGLAFEYRFLSEEKDKFFTLGDTVRIQQVLINLINNAIKFTHSGKVSVIVDQSVGIDDYQIVTFYVKDTGIGMRDHEVTQIFKAPKDESSHYNTHLIKDYRGGGMGLSISQKLVSLLGGTLKLETKENEGSAFYFSLQLKKTLNIKTADVESKPVELNKFRVLVAEDNRTNQKVIKFLLERQGADCTFAKNGREALELYKILDFDMVFMDIYMPDMDGLMATKLIRETEKYKIEGTPIVAVSASAFEQDIENAKLAGIDDFLAKPIETDKLKALIRKHAKAKNSA
ncbi:response regulator [Tamlana fucoidanivorans]|uniref:histidine kinase n=1 Tax=Allotamlana fucoidanivorans TaxID=2583814 RepID=A0A5C4SRJ0_9FLAO|nr:response regulator [Tamlana fucoidanivorans]TNJ46620.1 response regulator [Tamlana fucoidanivorans]